ncbi:hypothetical protein ABZ837_00175 [Streptomyces sp. NPDC047197]|uniref:hypothetical protein n=1 Tax=Streptomyces sp. NPDC047197 TaxID=3155477 RepID=UPI0033DA536A
MPDFMQQCQSPLWEPRDGLQSDRHVILAVRSLITDTLGWTAEDVFPRDEGLPRDVGAAVAVGVNQPWICVRADLPAGLRADLWGFCLALAVTMQDGGMPLGRGRALYVGQGPKPVTGPGSGAARRAHPQAPGSAPGRDGVSGAHGLHVAGEP